MKIIMEQSIFGENFFSKQIIDYEKKYRKFTYIVTETVSDGLLLYNTVTSELLLLEGKEIDVFKNVDLSYDLNDKLIRFLISNWFLVPFDNDDLKVVKQFTDFMMFFNRNVKTTTINTFRIYTTTDCNARCFYCYELGCKRRNMSEKTAHDTADFIARKSNGKKVKLAWFGGEPLYNSKVIDLICNDLIEKNIEYTSTMISNAYLFNDENVKKAAGLWNLKQVQITIDGTEEIYNRIKAYIYKDANAFKIVTDNIENLLINDIPVQIRINMDEHNDSDLFVLVKQLHERYGGYNNFGMYAHLLFEDSSFKIKNRSESQRQALVDKFVNLQNLIYSLGYSRAKTLNRVNHLVHCQCDNDSMTMILPDGELGKCQHYTDDHFYGSIYSEQVDTKLLNEFKEIITRSPKCDTCALRQHCLVLSACDSIPKRCDDFDEKIRWQSIRAQMRATYAKYTNDSSLKMASAN